MTASLDNFAHLPRRHYRAILADPPWRFMTYSSKGQQKAAQAHYDCMSLDEIKALPVCEIAADDCALVMWATAPLLPQAIETLEAWGFTFKTAGAWAKQSSTGQKWAFGTGYCFRSAAEFYLLGTRGKPKQKVRDVRNLIVAPIREHSRKPDEMHGNIKRLWDGPYLEMFARAPRADWTVWGNQTDRFAEVAE